MKPKRSFFVSEECPFAILKDPNFLCKYPIVQQCPVVDDLSQLRVSYLRFAKQNELYCLVEA